MSSAQNQIQLRIERSLARLEIKNISVAVDDAGNVSLLGAGVSHDDRSLAIAVARTVAGVATVTRQLQ